MSDAPARPRWFFLVTPRWLGWHVFMVGSVIGMLVLGDWQLRRALAGNALSWAYTFEWPIFSILFIVFWAKTIIDEMKPAAADDGAAADLELPAGAGRPLSHRAAAGDGEPDPELADYNAYLTELSKQVRGHGRWHGLR